MALPESIKKIDCQVISQSNFMCLSVQWKGTTEYALLDKFNGDQNALEGSFFTMEDGKTENTGSHISVTIHDGKTYVSQVLKVKSCCFIPYDIYWPIVFREQLHALNSRMSMS